MFYSGPLEWGGVAPTVEGIRASVIGNKGDRLIVASVDGHKATPTTQHTLVRKQAGQIRQPIGNGRAPFRVLVRSVGHNGRRSSLVSVPLR